MEHFKEFQKDFGILIESGFIAVKQGDEDSASKLFNASKTLNPDHSAPDIGLGYIHLSKLEIKKAKEIFQKVIDKEPNNYLALTFLGLCLMLGKTDMAKGENLVNKALNNSDDPAIQHFAQTVLTWKKEFFNKEPVTPFKS